MSNSNPGRSGPNGWFRSRGKTHLWITIEALWGKVEALSRLKNRQRPNFPTLFPGELFPQFLRAFFQLSDSDPALVALRERVFHMSRRCPRHGFAKIPRHYPRGHVNAGGDARGGEEAPFLHEMYLSLDGNSWKQLLHPIKKTPMRSSTFAVKQPGFAKQQGPCTDGSHRVNLSRACANPVDQTLVVHFPYRAPTTWDDQDIQRRTRIEIVIGHNLHPTSSHNWR